MMLQTFSEENFQSRCDILGSKDKDLQFVINTYGYPPMWSRPNSFETMVHIILEQQVSLASAKSALVKMQEKLQEITPAKILLLTDEDFRACYFSRQKMAYVKHLAEEIVNNRFDLATLEDKPDDEVRSALVGLKGVGNWTADVYLIFVLQRADIFPIGDLAAVKALMQLKGPLKDPSREAILKIADAWRPYRSVATMLLWHFYLQNRKREA